MRAEGILELPQGCHAEFVDDGRVREVVQYTINNDRFMVRFDTVLDDGRQVFMVDEMEAADHESMTEYTALARARCLKLLHAYEAPQLQRDDADYDVVKHALHLIVMEYFDRPIDHCDQNMIDARNLLKRVRA